MKGLIRRHPVLTACFALAVAATLFFGYRTVARTLYWMDPAHQAQALEPWMTPRYIAHSWLVDGRELSEHLGVPPDPKERPTLETIAEKRGVPLAQVIEEAQAYLDAHAKRSASE
ncbi:hypothetical protein [Vannielia litorea]|uniref:hypothetical protein n=1 Tax=Vannielia litorea TaxID=1217970 RepID=UPI001BCE8D4B|nr:hypothetical protein [Vannielia litorea]MBS8227462.1 hypothetical protein [Vannielia litorea]